MYKTVLAKLELDYTHLIKNLAENAKFVKNFLYVLSSLILLSFSLNENNQNTVYKTKFYLPHIFFAKFEK